MHVCASFFSADWRRCYNSPLDSRKKIVGAGRRPSRVQLAQQIATTNPNRGESLEFIGWFDSGYNSPLDSREKVVGAGRRPGRVQFVLKIPASAHDALQ